MRSRLRDLLLKTHFLLRDPNRDRGVRPGARYRDCSGRRRCGYSRKGPRGARSAPTRVPIPIAIGAGYTAPSGGRFTPAWDRTSPFGGEGGKVWDRRTSPVPVRPDVDLLIEPTSAGQPRPQERVFVPLVAISPPPIQSVRWRNFSYCSTPYSR